MQFDEGRIFIQVIGGRYGRYDETGMDALYPCRRKVTGAHGDFPTGRGQKFFLKKVLIFSAVCGIIYMSIWI